MNPSSAGALLTTTCLPDHLTRRRPGRVSKVGKVSLTHRAGDLTLRPYLPTLPSLHQQPVATITSRVTHQPTFQGMLPLV